MRTSSDHSGARPDLLAVYLNDHLAGSTAGVELVRRLASAHRGSPAGDILERLAAEIAQDRKSLVAVMRQLNVPIRRYKICTGWMAEKASRLKFNGYLVRRSPLSHVLELESLRLGVEGKAAGWRTLRLLADRDDRLDARRLDDLLGRARRQADALEKIRIRQASEVLGP